MRRRHFLASSPLLAFAGAGTAHAALQATPRQSAGPFYPDTLPLDHDNDLVQVAGRDGTAAGQVVHLGGRILDLDGTPIAGARVEIWQCDANGRYHHPRDRGGRDRDPAFQGYGQFRTGADGGYRFRTIRPVPYPGRTPHIHFAVTGPGGDALVTQMYVRGEPRNQRDWLFDRIPQHLRARVLTDLSPSATDPGSLAGRFDIVLPD